jgi:hypothetical protein
VRTAEQKATSRAYYLANRDKCIANGKRYYRENLEKAKAYGRARTRETLRPQEAIRLERVRAARQDPVLACELARFIVRCIKQQKKLLHEITGWDYHVDHIVPLCVGGTDAPWNIRVITAAENLARPRRG